MKEVQKNGAAATTQDVLTHHLNCFGDIVGTMADYTKRSRRSGDFPVPMSGKDAALMGNQRTNDNEGEIHG